MMKNHLLLTSSCAAAALTMGHRLARERAEYERRTLVFDASVRDHPAPPHVVLENGKTAYVVVDPQPGFVGF